MTNCYLSSIRAASGLHALHAHSLRANPPILASRRQLWFSNLIIKPSMKREMLLAPATVTRAAAGSSSSGWWTVDLPPNFTHVQSVQQLVDELAEGAKSDQLVVVDFFAPWCGACRSLFPKLKKICAEHPDVRFLAINFDENPGLARGLGVKMLPFFHMYRGAEGRVCAFTASVSKVAKLREAIESHKSPRCFLVQAPEYPLPEYPTVLPGDSTLRPDPFSRETPIAMA